MIRRVVAEADPGHAAGATAPAAPTRTRWGVITVAIIAGVAVAFQIGKVAAGLPMVSSDLGMGLFAASSILAGFNVVAALTGAALGVVAGRVGADRALVLGLVLTAVASALGGAMPNGPLLFLTTVAEGAGFVAVVIAAPSLIARAARADDAKLAFGLWGTYMPGGQAVMILLAPLLLGAIGWRGMWYLNAAVLATCALVAWWVIAEHPTRLAVSDTSTIGNTSARLLVQGSGLGMVIGPVAVGGLAQVAGGWQATPLVLSSAAACAVLLAVRLRRFEAPGMATR